MAKRAGFILCLVVCALGVGASHARADSPPPPAVIAAGVQIGSVDVSGLTADQATAAVEQAYFAPVVLHVVHRGYSVSPHHFHAALGGLDAAVQTALTAPADTAIRLTPTLDTKRVAKWVKTLRQEDVSRAGGGHGDPAPRPPLLHACAPGPHSAALPDAHADSRRGRER